MTPEQQLYGKLELVLLNKELTKAERSVHLAHVCSWFLAETELSMEDAFNFWNLTMVDILDDHPHLKAVQ